MCNFRYIFILGNLIGFIFPLPISYESNSQNSGPTTKVKSNLSHIKLQQMEPYTSEQDLKSFLSLKPIIQQKISLENEDDSLNKRSRRNLPQAQLDYPIDVDFDMELAEVNVFRPLFRYRAQVARNVGQRQQFG